MVSTFLGFKGVPMSELCALSILLRMVVLGAFGSLVLAGIGEDGAPKDHINIRILQSISFGIPLCILGLGART